VAAWSDDWYRSDLWVERSLAHGMSHRLPTALHTPKEARQRTAVQMLLAEHGMGELFKVL